ncbi:MAG: hypothetical protein NVS1B4_23830 [Gemmatimonadaceae bacterium]
MTKPSASTPPTSPPSLTRPAGAQVLGGNILSLLAAMGPSRATGERVLAEFGIRQVAADVWYPLASLVQAMAKIEETLGPSTLFKIGNQIPNFIPLPPGLDTFEAVAGSFAPAFAMNHRGVGAGGITHAITGPTSARITSGTPYSCDFDRGVVEGFFRKLLGNKWRFDHESGSCKKNGGATCTHLVSAAE